MNRKVKCEIEIDLDAVERLVEKQIAEECTAHYAREYDVKAGLRNGIAAAVKAYIYEHKDVIVERTVDRATKELVRKGLPKLIERIGDDQDG